MSKYFFKHLLKAIIYILSSIGFGWLIFQGGKFIGSALDNPGYGILIVIGIVLFFGSIQYAYEQAKIELKYSKK